MACRLYAPRARINFYDRVLPAFVYFPILCHSYVSPIIQETFTNRILISQNLFRTFSPDVETDQRPEN